jgi:molybdopterin synthase catalytic subunit
MRVRVRLFAIQRELAGTREVALDLEDGATIEDGWTALVARFPVLAPGRPSVRFARNGDYADASTALTDGDELACIPPVSGGGEPGPTIRVIQLRSEAFPTGLGEELGSKLATPGDGAVVVFAGRTRETPGTPAPGQEAEAAQHAGRRVDGLEYEAHEPMAEAVLGQIADEVAERFGVLRLAIVHRTGSVPLGEVSILVVAAAPHRDAAFAAARYAIDETKARAPIWKAERFADGHLWIGAPARTAAQPAEGSSAARTGPGTQREGS